MTKKEKLPEWIDRFHEGTLDGDELEQFLELLKDDPDLQEEVRADRFINESLEDRDLLEFRKAIQSATRKRDPGRRLTGWLLLAASVLVILGLALGYLFVRVAGDKTPLANARNSGAAADSSRDAGDKMQKQSAVGSRDTLRKTTKPDLLAQNFRPLPSLESLVGEAVRETGFQLKEPSFTVTLVRGKELEFVWQASDGMEVRIEVMDNLGRRKDQWIYAGSGSHLLTTGDFVPGLYYWKISTVSGLLAVGKLVLNPN